MRLIQEDGSLYNYLNCNSHTPLAPLGVEEGGACRDGGTIPGAYPTKRKQEQLKATKSKCAKKTKCGGFELTVGRNTAIQGIMP
jgi:hypothetical protein